MCRLARALKGCRRQRQANKCCLSQGMAKGKLRTWSPRSTRKVQRCLPTNHAPPVTKTRLPSMRGFVVTGVAGWLPCCMDACFACRAPDVVAAARQAGRCSLQFDPRMVYNCQASHAADRGSPSALVHLCELKLTANCIASSSSNKQPLQMFLQSFCCA